MIDIATIIELAASSTGALSSAADATERLKKIFRSSGSPDPEAQTVLLELLDKLIEAKSDQALIQDRLLALQREIEERDRFESEMARYALRTTALGAEVYVLKDGDESGEPPHCICPACLAKRQKQILQPDPEGRNWRVCFGCGARYLDQLKDGTGLRIGRARRPGLGRIDDF